jgi:4a-hydroxytetrahydrobiopterin dehydratase
MAEDLTQKVCRACEGHEKPLSLQEVSPFLEQVPNWDIAQIGKAIERSLVFKDFKEAIAFVNKVAVLAESEGHHPDIYIFGYNQIRISLTTHSINGLSENDFIVATKIDKLLKDNTKFNLASAD